MRGGFALPNGVDIALAVQMDAAIDGALVLRTVFTADVGSPTLTVYAPAAGTKGPSWSTPPASTTGTSSPQFLLDRGAGTTTLQPGSTAPTDVAVTTGPSTLGAPAGLAPLPVSVGGASVATAGGLVRLSAVPSGTRVDLNGLAIDVTQLVGSAFINMVQNTGNDRTIDTATTINVSLANTAAVSAATSAARLADLAAQVASRFVR